MLRLHSKRSALLFIAVVVLAAGDVKEAWPQTGSGLPLPPGNVVTGQVSKPPFTCPPNFVPRSRAAPKQTPIFFLSSVRPNLLSWRTYQPTWW